MEFENNNKIRFDTFKHIGIQKRVCGGLPTIIGHRLEPRFIVSYGTIEEAMEDFDLEREKVEECHRFMKEFGTVFDNE